MLACLLPPGCICEFYSKEEGGAPINPHVWHAGKMCWPASDSICEFYSKEEGELPQTRMFAMSAKCAGLPPTPFVISIVKRRGRSH